MVLRLRAPQLAACVWVGYPKAEISLVNVEGWSAVFGGSLPAMTWNRFMSEAVKKLPVLDFTYPQFTGHTGGWAENGTFAPRAGSRVEFLADGAKALPRMVEDVSAAESPSSTSRCAASARVWCAAGTPNAVFETGVDELLAALPTASIRPV